jgi:RNA polymerase sigma-70 factor (ECF subfamily)
MTAAVMALHMEETVARRGEDLHLADRDVAARSAAGDAVAFRELYLRHRQPVYAVIARMIVGEADREELLQDIFTQVYLSLGNFRGDSKLSTWIHRIAVNVTLQHIRHKGRRVRLQFRDETPAEELAVEIASATASSPEDEACLRDRKAAVERALSTLSPKKRIVLVLSDFEGHSSQEVSEIVGASSLTVRTRLFYARKEFYRAISKEAAFSDLAIKEVSG